jgi:predicted ATPase
MKEFITIQNFGPIIDIVDLEIKPYTFLIGESASGKSTIMKVLAMMRYLYKMANIRSYLKHSKITNSPFRLRFETFIKRQGMAGMLSSDSCIKYRAEISPEVSYEIVMENKTLRKLPLISREHLSLNKVSYISENRNVIPTWVEKASENAGATLGFYFHETNADFHRASQEDKVINLDYVGMKLYVTHPKGRPTKYQIEHQDCSKVKIDLKEASSGIQTSAPLVLVAKYFAQDYSFKEAFTRSVLSYLNDMDRLTKFKPATEPNELTRCVYMHIEEPELSLFPNAQCRMIDELVYAASHASSDRSMNMIIATHSPYILNYLNVMLLQRDETRARVDHTQMAVYRIYEGTAQDLIVRNENGDYLVDSFDLAEEMSNIYNEYQKLKG